jgi:hypothetical protein
MMATADDPKLAELRRLTGRWFTEATHPMMPGVVVHGSAEIEWLEGERFLIIRSRTDHPEFPDAVSILGSVDRDRVGEDQARREPPGLRMHYYDSRGVFRELTASIDATSWRLERIAPGFSQRFTGTFSEDGNTIAGLWQLCKDERTWHDDLKITYRRGK